MQLFGHDEIVRIHSFKEYAIGYIARYIRRVIILRKIYDEIAGINRSSGTDYGFI